MSAALLLLVAGNGYFGYGFGPGHKVEGDLAGAYTGEGEVGGRFVGGMRQGDTAFEASFFGTDLESRIDGESDSTFSVGLGMKQYVALSPNVELFARAGIDHTWLPALHDASGWGIDFGAGMEVGTAAGDRWGVRGWIDFGGQHANLHAHPPEPLENHGEPHDFTAGANFTSVTFGVSVTR